MYQRHCKVSVTLLGPHLPGVTNSSSIIKK